MQQAIFNYCVDEFGTYLFFLFNCTVYFCNKEINAFTSPHSAQRKHIFWGEIKQMSKSKKTAPRNKVALELLHYRFGHRSTRSSMAGDTENVWKDIELRIDPDPFCKSCQISSMDKKARSKNPLDPKVPFKWVCMDIIPGTAPKRLQVRPLL